MKWWFLFHYVYFVVPSSATRTKRDLHDERPPVAGISLLGTTAAHDSTISTTNPLKTSGGAYVWQQLAVTGSVPHSRQGHVLVSFDNDLFVIGGCVTDLECFNDVEQFNVPMHHWSPLQLRGRPMEPRGGHSVAMIGARAFIAFGANSARSYNDIFRIDFKQRRWQRGQPVRTNVSPKARTNHASCAGEKGKVYIFGGYDASGGEYLNDMWVMDTFWDGKWLDHAEDTFPIVWNKLDARGSIPTGRASHSATCIDNRVYIVGGYDNRKFGVGKAVSEMYVFDIATNIWSLIVPLGPIPQPRQGHVAQRLGQSLIILGGCDTSRNQDDDSEACLNDVWSFDTKSSEWTQKIGESASWTPREGAAGAFVGTQLLVFGGANSQQSFADITALNVPSLVCVHGKAQGQGQRHCTCDRGFTAYDCMEPVNCPMNCLSRGKCINNNCQCKINFFGDACDREAGDTDKGPLESTTRTEYGGTGIGTILHGIPAFKSANSTKQYEENLDEEKQHLGLAAPNYLKQPAPPNRNVGVPLTDGVEPNLNLGVNDARSNFQANPSLSNGFLPAAYTAGSATNQLSMSSNLVNPDSNVGSPSSFDGLEPGMMNQPSMNSGVVNPNISNLGSAPSVFNGLQPAYEATNQPSMNSGVVNANISNLVGSTSSSNPPQTASYGDQSNQPNNTNLGIYNPPTPNSGISAPSSEFYPVYGGDQFNSMVQPYAPSLPSGVAAYGDQSMNAGGAYYVYSSPQQMGPQQQQSPVSNMIMVPSVNGGAPGANYVMVNPLEQQQPSQPQTLMDPSIPFAPESEPQLVSDVPMMQPMTTSARDVNGMEYNMGQNNDGGVVLPQGVENASIPVLNSGGIKTMENASTNEFERQRALTSDTQPRIYAAPMMGNGYGRSPLTPPLVPLNGVVPGQETRDIIANEEEGQQQQIRKKDASFSASPPGGEALNTSSSMGDGSCPKSRCSEHGLCLSDGSCQCFPGFSGVHCDTGTAHCPEDCSSHGECKADATCTCDVGFSGPGCEVREKCPLGCCNRGICGKEECTCNGGWYGPACNLDLGAYRMFTTLAEQQKEELLEQAREKRAQAEKTKGIKNDLEAGMNSNNDNNDNDNDNNTSSPERMNAVAPQIEALQREMEELLSSARRLQAKAERTSIASLSTLMSVVATCPKNAGGGSGSGSGGKGSGAYVVGKKNLDLHAKGRHKKEVRNPTDDFGIDRLTKNGHEGAIKSKCKDNCNSKGYCEEGICFCQPGHYGDTCSEVKKVGAVSLGAMGICLTVSLLLSLSCTFSALQYMARQKRKAERDMGYLV